ncbi:ATP-binding protein [Paeniglutamicibacter antarcticus]|uniref:ATP-binding protein n=1 Tax=Arthrobacter terrae TaxID=2935737 RepID=A0A931G3P2_9MICC|nr:ATP-binding protein [Arthrobacter terrae]MBG0737938.1 ATP-binding protein [Arthrobacter terrae]
MSELISPTETAATETAATESVRASRASRHAGPEAAAAPWTVISADLTSRTARIARDVAAVLELHGSAGSGAAEAADFFRSWADSTSTQLDLVDAPLDALAARFALTPPELDLLLLAGLPEEHEGIAATFRGLHPQGEPRPTAGLAALILTNTLLSAGAAVPGDAACDIAAPDHAGAGSAAAVDARPALRRLLSSGEAVRHGLLRLAGNGTLFERSLIAADSLWEALHGHDAWPDGLPRVETGTVPPGLGCWLTGPGVRRAVAALQSDAGCSILVTGAHESIMLSRALAVADAAGRSIVAGRVTAGDTAGIALLAAHAALRGAVPLLVLAAVGQSEPDLLAVGDVPGPVLICSASTSVRAAGGRPMLALDAGPVGARDQQSAWAAALPHLSGQSAGIAARHPLDPALIAELAVDVLAQGSQPELAEITALIRARAGLTLPPGVQLLSPTVPWNHLVLPPEGAWQLRDAVSRLDYQSVVLEDWELRGRAHATGGTRMLFTGPPGTGKSLAAHAVATAAATDLLLVDVSRLVSKWLGETEKHLAAAFDAAERTQAVLLLDEADALFGTRTEISDANDRYANLETAYLLQRLDSFDGLVILTTNLRSNIDAAFIRRMDFVVEFPVPDADGRAELWSRHLPLAAVAGDIDLAALARLYPVPGGWIRNAAIAAAYVAAAGEDLISQAHLVAAMKREYAKAALRFPGEPPRRRND